MSLSTALNMQAAGLRVLAHSMGAHLLMSAIGPHTLNPRQGPHRLCFAAADSLQQVFTHMAEQLLRQEVPRSWDSMRYKAFYSHPDWMMRWLCQIQLEECLDSYKLVSCKMLRGLRQAAEPDTLTHQCAWLMELSTPSIAQ